MREYTSLPDLPVECSNLKPNEWNKKQAQLYFTWFTKIIPDRIKVFKEYFNLPENPLPHKEYILNVIHSVCSEIINNEWYISYLKGETGLTSKRLSGKGYSVAIDCGLYFLHLGELYFNKPYEWSIFTKYPKDYPQRNLPHYRNHLDGIYLDPQEFGITVAAYSINHMEDFSFILNTFRNYTGIDSEHV